MTRAAALRDLPTALTRTAALRVPLMPVLLVGLGLLGAACSVPEDSSPRALDYSRLPDDLATTPEPTEPSPLITQEVQFYLIDDNNLLHPTTRDVASPAGPATVLEALLSAPNETETDQALSTALPAEVEVVSVDIDRSRDLVTVALKSEVFEERLEGETRQLAVAQLVFTATHITGATRFLLWLNDNPVPLPTDDGESEAPVTRNDFRSVDPDHQIEPTATPEPTPVPATPTPTPTPAPEPTPTVVPVPTLPPGFTFNFSNNNGNDG